MNHHKLIWLVSLSSMFLYDHDLTLAQPVVATVSSLSRPTTANSKPTETQFIRLVEDSDGNPKSLETSITRFQNKDKTLLVDLIGVVHVGEENYYRRLNRQFEQYDSLLYELVAPPESRIPTKHQSRKSSSPVSWLQGSMQNMLGLESQLAHIDYTKSNFVHADLSPSEMQAKMAERGETAWSVGLSALSEMMKNSNQAGRNSAAAVVEDLTSFEDLFEMLNNPDKLKLMMAKQFTANDNLDSGLGPTLNRLLISDRNQAAMKVLRSEIENGQTKIGIFYGAAHMPDFEKRFVAELELNKTKQAWVEAWNLKPTDRATSRPKSLTESLFQLLNEF